MRLKFVSGVILGACLCGTFAAGQPQSLPAITPHTWLKQSLLALAQNPRLGGARVGMLVVELESGKVLAQHNATQVVPVASNVKLITSAAALQLLGPAYRFKTVAYGRLERGVVKGDLYLKGFGDPTLGESDLWELARMIYDAGVHRVAGALIVDGSFFTGRKLAPLYETRNDDSYYRPSSAALSINENAAAIRVFGADRPRKPARILVRPDCDYFKLKNAVRTGTRRKGSWIKLSTSPTPQTTAVEVLGRVRPGSRSRWYRRRVEHPQLMAGWAMLRALQRRGIRVGRPRPRIGVVPDKTPRLAVKRSSPLAVIVRYMNKASSNFVAEQLIRTIGAELDGEGSWSKGLAQVEKLLARRFGFAPGSFAMKNGSGLYEGNKFSPRQLVTVVRAMARDFRFAAEYLTALPVAGVDGTLKRRFGGSGAEYYLRGKTGTLAQVVSLSGIAGARSRRGPLVFSFVVSALPTGGIGPARLMVDAMGRILVTYLER